CRSCIRAKAALRLYRRPFASQRSRQRASNPPKSGLGHPFCVHVSCADSERANGISYSRSISSPARRAIHTSRLSLNPAYGISKVSVAQKTFPVRIGASRSLHLNRVQTPFPRGHWNRDLAPYCPASPFTRVVKNLKHVEKV